MKVWGRAAAAGASGGWAFGWAGGGGEGEQRAGGGALESWGARAGAGATRLDLQRRGAPQPQAHAALPRRPLPAVRRQREVGGQQGGVLPQEGLQVGGADLFLALEKQLDIDGQRACWRVG